MNATPSTAFFDKATTSNPVVDYVRKLDPKVKVSLAAQQLWCDLVYEAESKGYLFNSRIHSSYTVGAYPYNFTENMRVILADTAWMNCGKPTEEHGRVLWDLVDELWRAEIYLPQVVGYDPPGVHFHLAITDQLRRALSSRVICAI